MAADEHNLYKKFGLPDPEPFSTDLPIHVGEEHNEFRLIIKHHLNRLGFPDVRCDRHGPLAFESLKTRFAAVALEGDDLVGLGGSDLLKELCEDPAVIRPAFVLITKPINKAEMMLALEQGVNDLIVRPIQLGDLFLKIKNAYINFTHPHNPERLYEFAKQKLRANDLDAAYRIYESISRVSNHAARPFVGMARVAFLKKNYEEAITFAKRGIRHNEFYVHAYVLLGDVYAKMGDFESCLTHLKKAILLSPLNVVRYRQCVETLMDAQRIEECVQILNIGVNAGVSDPFVSSRLGECYFIQKKYATAIQYLREAVRLEPDNLSYANSLAICLRDAKEYEKSIQVYNNILKQEPENHQILFNKAITVLFLNKKDEAIKILQRVLKLSPQFTKAKEKLDELEGKTPAASTPPPPPTKGAA